MNILANINSIEAYGIQRNEVIQIENICPVCGKETITTSRGEVEGSFANLGTDIFSCENGCKLKKDHVINFHNQRIENLWDDFGSIPLDPDTERIEESFLHFPIGTHKEKIWKYFDNMHTKGLYWLMHKED